MATDADALRKIAALEVIRPESADNFAGIKLDTVMGVLDGAGIIYCQQIGEIVGIVMSLDDLDDADKASVVEAFLYDEFHFINLSRSKDGKQLKYAFETILRHFSENTETKQKGLMDKIMKK